MRIESLPDPPKKYSVVVSGVDEVTLAGSADPAFWSERLKREGLVPCVKDGRAEVLITATDSKWMGVSFKELTISVSICLQEDGFEPDGLFLAQAYNTRRFFTFVERNFYQTPYDLGAIMIRSRPPFAVEVGKRTPGYLRAEMKDILPEVGSDDESWEGPIFLPGAPAATTAKKQLFYARLAGLTRRYPFRPDEDPLLINPSPGYPVFQWLLDSNFAGAEWRVRNNATHARSRTYKMQPR
jgi:hypothetical protein